MSWEERRRVRRLMTVLTAELAVLLVVLGIRYQRTRNAAIPASGGGAEFRESSLLLPENRYTSLHYRNGAATLRFTLDGEGQWIWSDDPDFPLDGEAVAAILAAVSGLTPLRTVTDSETLAACGFESPSATLTASGERDARSLTFGAAAEDGRYVRLDGEENAAYVVDGALYELLQTPIYDMAVLPELPRLTEDKLLSLSVRGPAAEGGEQRLTFLSPGQGADGAVTWSAAGAGVTDRPQVRELLEDLEHLAFSRCVDYRPSKEAVSLCGFDNPAAELTVTYAGENGEAGMLAVAVGSALKGGRYARLEGTDAIYLLPEELAEPLLSVAASGLADT